MKLGKLRNTKGAEPRNFMQINQYGEILVTVK